MTSKYLRHRKWDILQTLPTLSLLVILSAACSQKSEDGVSSEASEISSSAFTANLDTPPSDDLIDPSAPVADDRTEQTLLPQERAEWASDAESYGFNEEDQAFLKQHGLSEAEARAAETILRENGIN